MPQSVWSAVGMLAVAIAILFLAYLATRWLGLRQSSSVGSGRIRGNGTGPFRVLWQMNLGRSERIVLIQLGEAKDKKYLLLGVTAYSITSLRELTGEEAAEWFSEEDRAPVPGFAEILKDNLWKRK